MRRRHASGEALFGIARTMGLARATVRKYAATDTFPTRLPHGPSPSLLDPYVDHFLGRIGEGCENAIPLWCEIRERGYPGTSRQVHRFVAEPRTKPTRSGRKARSETMPVPEMPAAEPPKLDVCSGYGPITGSDAHVRHLSLGYADRRLDVDLV